MSEIRVVSGHEGRRSAEEEASRWVRRLARIGYGAKGVVYVAVGVVAASAAFQAGRAGGSRVS